MKHLKKRIIKNNKARCLKCDEILESTYCNTFQSCSCGNVSVEGAHAFVRHQWFDKENYEDLSEFEEVTDS